MLRISIKPLVVALSAATLTQTAIAGVDVNLRTFYFNRDFSEGTAESREALTQAIQLNYTDQVSDRLNVGASLFANLRLYDDNDAHLTGLLDSDGDGYAKLAQIYADYSMTESLSIRVGRWVTNTPLLSDSDSRATPSSTQAIKLKQSFDNGQLYLIYSDRASAKTDSSFTKYTDKNGDDYDIVLVGADINYTNGISLAAAYGKADGYAEQGYLSVSAPVTDDVSFSLTHYSGEGEGTNSDFDADLTNVAASYQGESFKLSAGYQTVSGDSGYDYFWGGDDDNSLQTSNAVQIMDFNRKDEDSWQLRADYQFHSIAGLSAMVRHTTGEYSDGADRVDEAETNAELAYTLGQDSLSGLKLRMRLSHVEADAYSDINEVRLIANYSF